MVYETVEDFFLNRMDIGRVFEAMERTEYLFLINILRCSEDSGDDKVYMSDLAGQMNLSVIETSRAVKSLEDSGYVVWKTDENKERTYVELTGKAKDAIARQHHRMETAYQRITTEISDEEMRQVITTLEKVRAIIKENDAAAQ